MFEPLHNLQTHTEEKQGFENNSQEHKCKLGGKAIKKRLKCNLCSETFHSEIVMNVHIKSVHEGCKDYKCETLKILTERGSLYRHIRSVHEGFKYFTIVSEFRLKRHFWVELGQ